MKKLNLLKTFVQEKILRGTTREQWRNGGVTLGLLLVALLAIGYVLAQRFVGDDPMMIVAGQENLRKLRVALRLYQSERYFAVPPAELVNLWNAAQIPEIFLLPSASTVSAPQAVKIIPAPLVESLHDFRAPTRVKPQEVLSAYVADYLLHPQYTAFLPPKTLIMLDRPGNYQSGGNIIFNDGTTQFLALSAAEYQRFVNAFIAQNDRDFVRAKCASCSLAGFKP